MVTRFQIERIFSALLRKKDIEHHRARLKWLGSSAVPAIVPFLQESDNRPLQTIAFFALQYCWSKKAIPWVTPFLSHTDSELRTMAAIVLAHGGGFELLCDACRPLLDHTNPEVVMFALSHIEPEEPNRERMEKKIQNPHFWPVLAPHLPRYRQPTLITPILTLLRQGSQNIKPHAIAALIQQTERKSEIYPAILEQLHNPEPSVREMVGEYFTWHDNLKAIPLLENAIKHETDSFAKASLYAAIKTMRFRAKIKHNKPSDSQSDPLILPPMEPHWAYRGQKPPTPLVRQKENENNLLKKRFSFPIANTTTTHPSTQRWVHTPVRDYFDPERTTYGKEIEPSAIKGFSGMVHVGDDVAWNRPHLSVIAVDSGKVCQVEHDTTWGNKIIIEHIPKHREQFCALYAHLTPALLVSPGDWVNAGDKIGSIGRSFSWENGGYASHLHFAIHRGKYHHIPKLDTLMDVRFQGRLYRGRVVCSDTKSTTLEIWNPRNGYQLVHKATSWVVGYLSKEAWESEDHGWQAPQTWLKKWMKR